MSYSQKELKAFSKSVRELLAAVFPDGDGMNIDQTHPIDERYTHQDVRDKTHFLAIHVNISSKKSAAGEQIRSFLEQNGISTTECKKPGREYGLTQCILIDTQQPNFEVNLTALIQNHKQAILAAAHDEMLPQKTSLMDLLQRIPTLPDGSALDPVTAKQAIDRVKTAYKDAELALGIDRTRLSHAESGSWQSIVDDDTARPLQRS